ncbi:MAG: hypothetical protein IKD45_05950 [Clostridia bacterium]|nr:hypothetical protein [Clostridia bacterium]
MANGYKNMRDEINRALSKFEPCYGTAYIRHMRGLYLAMDDKGICLSRERFLWRIEAWENDRFYIRDISGHDQLESFEKNVSKALDSGYTAQHWRIYNGGGDFVLFEHVNSNGFLACSEEDKPVIHDGYNDESCYFTLEDECLTPGYPYLEFESKTRRIILRTEPTVLYYANEKWLLDWLNDLERVYFSFSRLVGFYPFPKIEVRAYTNCNSWGYIYRGKPVIHINNECMKNDIIKMRKCKNRFISFGTIHEMSHLFDKRAWQFDVEAIANVKLGYVLHELDINTTLLPETDYADLNRKNFADKLYDEHGKLDNVKGLFCSALTAKIVKVAEVIGWEPFMKLFRSFPEIDNESSLVKFKTFIQKLSEYSGKDVRSMFTAAEWRSVEQRLS